VGRVAPGVYGPATRPLPLPAARPKTTSSQGLGPSWRNAFLVPVPGDAWGAVSIPAQPQGDGAVLGDPALTRTLQFLYAYLVTDAGANVPWTAQFGYPLIKSPLSLFTHNPNEAVFQVDYLPSLYLWRPEGGDFEQKADDYLLDNSAWTMLWVMPLASQENQSARSPYVNQFAKAVADGLNHARTPSWSLLGDPDPLAASLGSFLWGALNVVMQYPARWRTSKVLAQPIDGGKPREFKAVEMKISVVERLHENPARYATRGTTLDATFTNQFGLPVGRTLVS
jgi:hypothetical protein